MVHGPMGLLTAVVMASCVLAEAGEAQMSRAADPVFGVWKLDVERSVYSPGPRPPSDLVSLRQYEPIEDGFRRFILTSTNAQGDVTFQIGVYKLDGARHPVHNVNTLTGRMLGGQGPGMTRSYRVIDDRTVEFITYTDGVAGLPGVRQMAPDGMSFIQTVKGVNAQGVEINNVTFWERVQ